MAIPANKYVIQAEDLSKTAIRSVQLLDQLNRALDEMDQADSETKDEKANGVMIVRAKSREFLSALIEPEIKNQQA